MNNKHAIVLDKIKVAEKTICDTISILIVCIQSENENLIAFYHSELCTLKEEVKLLKELIYTMTEIDDSSANQPKKKYMNDDLFLQKINDILLSGISVERQKLVDALTNEFEISVRTAETRLKDCIDNKTIFQNYYGIECHLEKHIEDKKCHYSLFPTNDELNRETLTIPFGS